MTTPYELLVTLDDAIATGPPWWSTHYALEVRAPRLLTEQGHPLGDGWYGYTKRECRRVRAAVLDAARADLTGH